MGHQGRAGSQVKVAAPVTWVAIFPAGNGNPAAGAADLLMVSVLMAPRCAFLRRRKIAADLQGSVVEIGGASSSLISKLPKEVEVFHSDIACSAGVVDEVEE